MVQTRKFSQFNPPVQVLPTDIVVGLRNGQNQQFIGVGSGGGGGGVTHDITQLSPLAIGQWVRVDAAGVYVPALADNSQDGEVIGVVVAIPAANTYTIQQSGYITTAMNVFMGLIAGDPYFLDTVVAGNMTTLDPSVTNEVSRPVFVADTGTSGWVIPYRGLIVGGVAPTGGGGGGTTPEIITITQNGHGLNVGDWIRIAAPVAGQPHYITAQANNLTNSQAVGVVIQVINPNQFVLQFSGYNAGAVTMDAGGLPLVASTVYYLSPTVAGAITSTPPNIIGQINKPLFISEQTTATTGANAGWILPQRPLDINHINNSVHVVTQANAFAPGDWLYIQPGGTYAKAQANTLATSQVAGVVIEATPTEFTIQQSGWISGAVTQDQAFNPLVSGTIYYLSPTTAGALQNVAPSTVGQVTKPCYVQESLATFTGQILPQRPLLITPSGGGGSGTGPIVQSITSTNNVRSDLITTAAWTTYPGLSVTITPTAATSRLKIMAHLTYAPYTAQAGEVRLVRDGVPVAAGLGTNPSGLLGVAATTLPNSSGGGATLGANTSFLVSDPALNTNPTTYTVEVRTNNGVTPTPIAINTNQPGAGTRDAAISTLTVEEVA